MIRLLSDSFSTVTVLYLSVPQHFNLFLDPSLADADLYIHYFQQDQPRTKEQEETGGAGEDEDSEVPLRDAALSQAVQ